MTKQQIEYQRLQEEIRSNKATEALTAMRDAGTLNVRQSELGENKRHNQATEFESLRSHNASESEVKRHNAAVEEISRAELYSKNLAAEARYHQAEAAHRSANINAAKLAEDVRYHNLEYSNKQRSMDIDARRVDASMIQANTQRYLAQFEPQRLELNTRDVDTRARTGASNIELNSARAEQTRKETSYLGQENVRDWIDTGSQAVRNVGAGLSAISKFSLPSKVWNMKSSEYFTTD